MVRSRILALTAGACLCLVSTSRASEIRIQRGRILRQSASPSSYSVEIPAVARIQGTAFFRTSVDINNNTTTGGVTAQYQFSYTCFAASCNPVGDFNSTAPQTITLPKFGNFHQDDWVQYLDSLGLLVPGAAQGCFGTLLITFDNLPSGHGWEGTAVARTYNRLNEADPLSGTVGFAYNASLFFESTSTTLVGFARDTKASPTVAGKLRSNVGVRNTDLNDAKTPCPSFPPPPAPNPPNEGCVTVVLSFFDTATGNEVGTEQTMTDLRPGELRQISDLWATAKIDSSVNSVIVFVDSRSPAAVPATFEGYVTTIEGQVTQDAAFYEMKCAAGCQTF